MALVLPDDCSGDGKIAEMMSVLLRRAKYGGMEESSDIRLHCAFPKSVDILGQVAKAGTVGRS